MAPTSSWRWQHEVASAMGPHTLELRAYVPDWQICSTWRPWRHVAKCGINDVDMDALCNSCAHYCCHGSRNMGNVGLPTSLVMHVCCCYAEDVVRNQRWYMDCR